MKRGATHTPMDSAEQHFILYHVARVLMAIMPLSCLDLRLHQRMRFIKAQLRSVMRITSAELTMVPHVSQSFFSLSLSIKTRDLLAYTAHSEQCTSRYISMSGLFRVYIIKSDLRGRALSSSLSSDQSTLFRGIKPSVCFRLIRSALRTFKLCECFGPAQCEDISMDLVNLFSLWFCVCGCHYTDRDTLPLGITVGSSHHRDCDHSTYLSLEAAHVYAGKSCVTCEYHDGQTFKTFEPHHRIPLIFPFPS